MEDNKYQYDENGFREDLKDDPDVLHQPDADRTQRDLVILDYDETMAFLNGEKEVKTIYDFSDDVLEKIKEKYPTLNDTPINKVIMEKYQQILSARYNESQANNKTVHVDDSEENDEQPNNVYYFNCLFRISNLGKSFAQSTRLFATQRPDKVTKDFIRVIRQEKRLNWILCILAIIVFMTTSRYSVLLMSIITIIELLLVTRMDRVKNEMID